MTTLGAVLGIGSFVSVLGITATANAQITDRFNAMVATQVEVRQADQTSGQYKFPSDANERIARIEGVKNSTVYWSLDNFQISVLPPGLDDSQAYDARNVPVVAATPGIWRIAQAELEEGRTFDDMIPGQRVAVVGHGLAAILGLSAVNELPTLYINDIPYATIGVTNSSQRTKDVENAIVIPADIALGDFGEPVLPATMMVETELGAASVVAEAAPLALDEFSPDSFTAVPPVDASNLQENVSQNLRNLFLVLAGICLAVGAVGIANANFIAVMDRTPEIGLRRSLGAMPRHVALQFLMESGTLGLLGGLVGACMSIFAVIGLSVVQGWTPVISPGVTIAAPIAGTLVGFVAGAFPAYKASRIDPVEAFRK